MSGDRSARELLLQVGVERELCAGLRPGDDLLAAGVASAALIELSLVLEDAIGRQLQADEVERLTTLAHLEALLGRSREGERCR